MAEARESNRTFTWAPRALAVISCALALLAAQPAADGVAAVRKGAVAVGEGGRGWATAGETPAVQGGSLAECAPRVCDDGRDARGTGRAVGGMRVAGVRWHILATMEILHRLLAGELRGAERQMLPAVWFDEVCIGVAAEPAKVARRVEAVGEAIPIVEREYAIGHCLLAPPIS
jgi:hypothetical protein